MINEIIKYDLSDINFENYPYMININCKIENLFNKIKKRMYKESYSDIKELIDLCTKFKNDAVSKNEEKDANISFLLKTYLNLLQSITKFWELCDFLEYQEAWSYLQDGLDYVFVLKKFVSNKSNFSIIEIGNYLENIENLYPYSYFISLEGITENKICSVCKRSPFDKACIHIAGNLYMGEMAIIEKRKMKFLGFSLVENPKDKRCVVFMNCDKKDIENTPFKQLHKLIEIIGYPLNNFTIIKTKRKMPRQYYDSWSPNSLCPCGNKTLFKDCCFNEKFIFNPHYIIENVGEIKLKF